MSVFGDAAPVTWWRKIWRKLRLALSSPVLPSRRAGVLGDLRHIANERRDFIGRTCRNAADEIERLSA